MSEPNFNLLSLPQVVIAEIDQRIGALRVELQQGDASAMLEPLSRLMKVRGNFAFDLISSIAWAAQVVCGSAAKDQRVLNSVEVRSLSHAIDSMDRARRTAILAAAM
jgi:hypothetical protein